MANTKHPQTETSIVPVVVEDVAVKAVNKRYEGLMTVRNKAVKGKGAWYWAHLEPIMVRNPDTNLPKAVKLKCTLCDAAFSASNPSRTASEHLKRGTCPNFTSVLKPIHPHSQSHNQLPPLASPSSQTNHRKRTSENDAGADSSRSGSGYWGLNHQQHPHQHQHLMLSGGKEDLGALAMLEDSVKKLRSPKSSPGLLLNKVQIDAAFGFLADWLYESYGSPVSFSSLEHPKFKAFLNQVGLPVISRKEFTCSRLDSKFERAKFESEAKIRDAVFFQISYDGWKSSSNCYNNKQAGENSLIKVMVNLPNGTSLFQSAVFNGGSLTSKYAEEMLWEAVMSTCDNVVDRCVGIVADKFKGKALRNLENQHHWMVNLSCQFQAIISLCKDFSKEFQLYKTVIDNCLKIANLFSSESQARSSFNKFRSQEIAFSGCVGVCLSKCDNSKDFVSVMRMLEDVLSCARVLQLVVMDDSYKVLLMEDPLAREVAEMIQDVGFWNDVEAIHSLVKLIRGMAEEIESERPLVAQCLPLWEELKAKVKEWCVKFSISEGPVERIVETRFMKNYHPAWSAAFILDPVYLMRDATGKYLPPFKCLTHEQEKDVDRLVTRLVPREEAHIVLMELMKWRSEGLDPLYAQAVQVKQRDPVSGKMKIANPQSSRLVWETILKEYTSLGKVAVRLLFLHATSCGLKCNGSFMRWIYMQGHSSLGMDRVQKMIFVAANARLERRDISGEEEKEAELFATTSGEDDMLNEVFAEAPSAWTCIRFSDFQKLNEWSLAQSSGYLAMIVKRLFDQTGSNDVVGLRKHMTLAERDLMIPLGRLVNTDCSPTRGVGDAIELCHCVSPSHSFCSVTTFNSVCEGKSEDISAAGVLELRCLCNNIISVLQRLPAKVE